MSDRTSGGHHGFAGCLGFCFAGLYLLHGVPFCRSGEPAQPGNALDGSTQAVATAVAAAAIHDSTGTIAVLLAGKTLNIWEGTATPPHATSPAIDPDLLAGVEDKAPVRSAAENYDEARAYNYLVVQASATSVAAFAAGARRDLTFAHLFEEPSKYRGQVVHIEGRLGRLRRFEAPRLAAQQGVPVLYEGWIFGDAYFSNPYCVIATDNLNLPLGETLNHRVSFDGYFFKRYRYKAGDGWRDAPLLIGHAMQDREQITAAANSSDPFGTLLLSFLVAAMAASVLLVIGLNWWFRRGDRRLRTHLDRARNANFVEPG
jgi:hypothetical protein